MGGGGRKDREGWGERGKWQGEEGRGDAGAGGAPDRVCALPTERATECGVAMTENGPGKP